MMGGATENDEAMKWFLQRAYGGDVLVLRASGSDGYNDYMYSDLGVTVNSVETIVFHDASAAFDPYIADKISKAEAIWIAGGDQWDYISFWRNTPVANLINDGIENRGLTTGGTSAGMAILGGFYFTAENGTVTSGEAVLNPFHPNVTVDSAAFLQNNFLEEVITDTHYDNPERKGRHIVFLAHILENYGVDAKGIACEEYTAVCIDENGLAHVFGDYPSYDDYAFFIQKNCAYDSINAYPEVYTPGSPLTWNYSGDILKVYQVPGTLSGTNTFDLTGWETGSGGTWVDWSVNASTFTESFVADAPNCTAGQDETFFNEVSIYPNPVENESIIEFKAPGKREIELFDARGKRLKKRIANNTNLTLDFSSFAPGIYQLKITSEGLIETARIVKN